MKYKLTNKTLEINGRIFHRIKALIDFNNVKKGDLGGWIEKGSNLSQEGNCWVYDNAKVCDNAFVCGSARVYDKAVVRDDAKVCGSAWVCGNAVVCDKAVVRDDAKVCGNAKVRDNAVVKGYAEIYGDAIIEKMGDYIVFQNWWSSDRWFTYTKSNKMWKVGCFYGTSEELIKKAYADSEEKGKCYSETVRYIQNISVIIQ